MTGNYIPFNRAYVTGNEFANMQAAIENAHLAGNGPFSVRCREWLEHEMGTKRALLTHSCTGALEMSFTLADIGPGDEVVMPSFTFVSTATAVVARGGTPVFAEITPDTLCLDCERLDEVLTERTKAVVPVHYAGISCDMDALLGRAARDGLMIIEDAAHGIRASFKGRPLGSIGDLGTLSFHETKNVSCGEGGALLVNYESLVERAEIVHEKGTDRQRFFRGQVDKYTWVDVGSSYPLSDLAAAYLWAQLAEVDAITALRVAIWQQYHEAFAELERRGDIRRPVVASDSIHNGHLYYLLVEDLATRSRLISHLANRNINAVFHYVPLHTSVAGRRYGRAAGDLRITESVSERLVRLPLWAGMSEADVGRVIAGVLDFYEGRGDSRSSAVDRAGLPA
jgi:dTDP-4-amino-4,6-dideoxygalactose transaminase